MRFLRTFYGRVINTGLMPNLVLFGKNPQKKHRPLPAKSNEGAVYYLIIIKKTG